MVDCAFILVWLACDEAKTQHRLLFATLHIFSCAYKFIVCLPFAVVANLTTEAALATLSEEQVGIRKQLASETKRADKLEFDLRNAEEDFETVNMDRNFQAERCQQLEAKLAAQQKELTTAQQHKELAEERLAIANDRVQTLEAARSDEADEQQSQLDAARQEVAALRLQSAEAVQQAHDAESKLQQVTTQFTEGQERLQAATEQVELQQKTVSSLQQQLTELRERLSTAEAVAEQKENDGTYWQHSSGEWVERCVSEHK